MDTPALEALRTVSGAAEQARALPAACYRDPAFFEAEVERIMRAEWHPVARHDALPEPGDYRSLDLYGEPILLLRDAGRRLRAYSRVCLHRAQTITTGEGHAKRLVCPYHRWSYDLDGRLVAAPLMEGVPGFEREACRLPEFALEEWQGFVFVNLDARATPLAPRLAPAADLLGDWNVAKMRVAGTLDYDSPWNWKVMVENFIESYHHIGGHAKTLQRSNPAAGTHAVDLDGPFALLENPSVEGGSPFWVLVGFPTLLFALTRADPPFGFWYEMQVDGPAHFHLRIHLLVPPEVASDDPFVGVLLRASDAIHQEDIPLCEGIQRGVRSRVWQPGRLSPLEKTVWLFHRYLAEKLLD